jgi:hypothetical protein
MEHRSLAPIVMGVWAAESDQAPVAVSRPGGAPFAEIEAATRVGGRWIIATAQDPSESAATVLWELDGAAAREVRRFPRTLSDGGRRQTRLARRGGRAIGVAVDGQPDLARPPSVWVLGVDLESGVTLDPEPVASLTAWGREAPICTGDDSGWELDVPYPGTLDVQRGDAAPITLQTPIAHILASSDHVCRTLSRNGQSVRDGSSDRPGRANRRDAQPCPRARSGAALGGRQRDVGDAALSTSLLGAIDPSSTRRSRDRSCPGQRLSTLHAEPSATPVFPANWSWHEHC